MFTVIVYQQFALRSFEAGFFQKLARRFFVLYDVFADTIDGIKARFGIEAVKGAGLEIKKEDSST